MADDRFHGVLLVYKPVGMTSHDAIYRVRRATGQQGGGHTGTLDPLAEGLLVVCLGSATKIVRYLTDMDKTYEAVIRLGIVSETYDSEGVPPDAEPVAVHDFSDLQIETELNKFLGQITQQVPMFSAVKVDGRPLYKDARRGRTPTSLPERTVVVHELRLVARNGSDLRVVIRCSKGTYIRSVAHDLGQRLGCGAYLAELKRTSIGGFSLDDALTFDDIMRLRSNRELEKHLLPPERVLPFAALEVSDLLAARIAQGPRVTWSDVVRIDGAFCAGDTVMLKDRTGVCLAIGRAQSSSSAHDGLTDTELFKYDRVLN